MSTTCFKTFETAIGYFQQPHKSPESALKLKCITLWRRFKPLQWFNAHIIFQINFWHEFSEESYTQETSVTLFG